MIAGASVGLRHCPSSVATGREDVSARTNDRVRVPRREATASRVKPSRIRTRFSSVSRNQEGADTDTRHRAFLAWRLLWSRWKKGRETHEQAPRSAPQARAHLHVGNP